MAVERERKPGEIESSDTSSPLSGNFPLDETLLDDLAFAAQVRAVMQPDDPYYCDLVTTDDESSKLSEFIPEVTDHRVYSFDFRTKGPSLAQVLSELQEAEERQTPAESPKVMVAPTTAQNSEVQQSIVHNDQVVEKTSPAAQVSVRLKLEHADESEHLRHPMISLAVPSLKQEHRPSRRTPIEAVQRVIGKIVFGNLAPFRFRD